MRAAAVVLVAAGVVVLVVVVAVCTARLLYMQVLVVSEVVLKDGAEGEARAPVVGKQC